MEEERTFSKEDIKNLIDHIIEVRTKRFQKLRKDGASPDLSIAFMVGANTILNQVQYFYENGEIYNDESEVEN